MLAGWALGSWALFTVLFRFGTPRYAVPVLAPLALFAALPALALVEAAYRHNPRLGEEVSLGLRDALFEEGCDLADPAELAGFAEHVGVPEVTEADHRAVLASLEEGRARGVKGSPHFFCGGADSFCPTLDIGRDEAGELRIGLQTTALRTFLEDCLT